MTNGDVTTEYRFAPIPEALLYDHRIGHLGVRLYAALMRHGLTPESCYPKQRTLATLIGCAPRSVARPLAELEETGWISRTPRYGDDGERLSDGYALHSAPHRADVRGGPAQEPSPPPRASARSRTRASEREPMNELFDGDAVARATPAPTGEELFERFWQAYPRRTAKGAARTAFAKAIKRELAGEVIAGAERYAADPNLPQEAFIPHASTWLNGERWSDGPLPAGSGRPRAGVPRRDMVDTDRSAPSGRVKM